MCCYLLTYGDLCIAWRLIDLRRALVSQQYSNVVATFKTYTL